MGQVVRVSILVLLMSCAHRPTGFPPFRANIATTLAPHVPAQVAAPATLDPKPWVLGQWALYKTTLYGEPAYQRHAIVAIDACGMWIQVVTQSVFFHATWTACVRPGAGNKLRVVYVVEDVNGHVSTADRRADPQDAWQLRMFVPIPAAARAGAGEALDVAAGHFEGAVRASLDGETWWWHPTVPFSGGVKVVQASGSTTELVAFGDTGAPTFVSPLAEKIVAASTPRVPPRGFISIGYGLVSPEGYRSSDTDTSRNLRFRAGARIGSRFELYGELVDGDELQYKPDPTQTQHTALILVGTRWTFLDAPSRGPLLGAFELYLRGGLGLGTVTRSSTLAEISTQTGLGVTVGGGYYKRVVEASGFGGDVTDDIVVTRDGTRHNLSFNAFLQVQLPLGF